ncbi:cobalt-precorrin-6X reductase [Aureimonas sp. Leaf454]|uniref:cobalt-precorrin-6A reductase n=1 Tax=Aureimonas sp. Leaf454 TaxID=1736381 RepID=UPI0006F63B16|nr:cobalt-precorrin-6A reductase [Aureimonas sp. Leaf454]KQT46218.1 cobalt-precorrin-6X reductase [Aureimonas sp. Leaf454]
MPAETILLLAGTAEGRALAERISEERPDSRLVTALAGRTLFPKRPAGEVRVGGFGGAEGLARFLLAEGVTRLVDATHPFAAGIARNAAQAASGTGVPRLKLLRPAWTPGARDRWTPVSCLGAARDALPEGARPFLALGRQHLAPFRHRSDLRPVLRMVDPPEEPLPFLADLVLGLPSADPVEEIALFRRFGVTHLVCRNSGGDASSAKLVAARRLGLPVVIVARPVSPPGPTVSELQEVLDWLS